MKEKLIKRLLEIVSQYNKSSENLKSYHLGRIHAITDACQYAGIYNIVEFSSDWGTATVKILYVAEGVFNMNKPNNSLTVTIKITRHELVDLMIACVVCSESGEDHPDSWSKLYNKLRRCLALHDLKH